MITSESGQRAGFGQFSVTVIPHFLISTRYGTKLAAKLWLPEDALSCKDWFSCDVCSAALYDAGLEALKEASYPAILEYIPYRKSDFTVQRDHQRHTWFASHGYVCVRVDIRGSGDSEGLLHDEYLAQEQQDATDVIEWIAKQPWCNGKVGMYGKSWGGYTGLQVAFERPAALHAVVSLYSTHDRYSIDVHHEGGCTQASSLMSWASRMFVWNACPPCPANVPNWKEIWLERLHKATEPWIVKWLSHPRRDDYWKHGSIATDYSRVTVPVLAIGGWQDAYRDSVFHMAECLQDVRAIIGPWSHDWPDNPHPGPTIDYLPECLRWWDYHLKGIVTNGAMDVPLLRVYMRDSIPPSPTCAVDYWPGRWVGVPVAPNNNDGKGIALISSKFALTSDRKLTPHIQSAEPDMVMETRGHNLSSHENAGWIDLQDNVACGQTAGEWLMFGEAGSYAGDQSLDDEASVVWTSDVLDDAVPILGLPTVSLGFNINDDGSDEKESAGQLCLRLCDVFPDDTSALITYGVHNMARVTELVTSASRDSLENDDTDGIVVYPAILQMHATSLIVPAGHRLRLAISTSYWPRVWPSSRTTRLSILTGDDNSYIVIPLCTGTNSCNQVPCSADSRSGDDKSRAGTSGANHMNCLMANGLQYLVGPGAEQPKKGPPADVEFDRPNKLEITTKHDVATGEHLRTIVNDAGRYTMTDETQRCTTTIDEVSEERYTIDESGPTSARVSIHRVLKMTWKSGGAGSETCDEPTEVSTQMYGKSLMWSDDDYFHTDNELMVTMDDIEIYKKRWVDSVDRADC